MILMKINTAIYHADRQSRYPIEPAQAIPMQDAAHNDDARLEAISEMEFSLMASQYVGQARLVRRKLMVRCHASSATSGL